MISEVMAEEVNALCSPKLCGPKHRPNESDYTRAGSSPGRVLVDGGHEQVVRPRVHQTAQLAKPREVRLASYRAACDPEQLSGAIIQALASDVSTREVKKVKSYSPGVSKSNVSMHWQHVGQNFVNEFRSKDLSKPNWVALLLDGIRLSKDQLAIVALGITAEGLKVVLDFELGSSESAEVSKDLTRRLSKQGFSYVTGFFSRLRE